MNIVILAAGQGKRMHSDLPKVLHPLAGRSLLGHVLEQCRALQPRRLIVVHGHGGAQVRARHPDPNLIWVNQAQQLGTGHAVQQALPELDATMPTLVLYGDVPLTRSTTLKRLLTHTGTDQLGLLTVHLTQPDGYGRIVRQPHTDPAANAIVGVVEHKDATPAQRAIQEVNTGIMVAPTSALRTWLAGLSNHNAQGEYYLTDIVAAAVASGTPVVSTQPDAVWETLGVNSPQQLADLERIYQQQQAQILLEQGVRLADPARLDVRGTLRAGRDCAIDINCIFEGTVVLGDRVTIGAHCVLRDVTIGADTTILPMSYVESSDIGAHARIGPFARVRPGTQLGDHTHIGNFVEIKNTHMGAYSKANHLAYLGDSTVGERVNVGAGVITCNYDGAHKHRTIIEDDAFIGSDSQLVAPVTVGRGATLGAGTTLVRNAPPEQLTVSRSTQRSIAGWQRPHPSPPSKE